MVITGLMTIVTISGQNWTNQSSNTNSDLYNINFVDNNTGWTFGDSTSGVTFIRPIIRKTTDGGTTWSVQDLLTSDYKILSSYFFNTLSGIAVGKYQITGDGVVLTTTNGGTSWSANTNIPERLFDVDFADSNNGWIVGRNGYIGKTSNGGTSWTTQTSGTNEHIYSVDFTDANNGHAVGATRTIYNTVNGGNSWSMADTTGLPVVDLNAVFFTNAANGWAVGVAGTIIATSDTGKSWTIQNSGTTKDLFDVSFVNASNGWAVGLNGTIVKTTNGGTSWLTDASGTINNINSIAMKSTGQGWFCGNKGDIFKYVGPPVTVKEMELHTLAIKFYPNPSDEWFIIEYKNYDMHWSLFLYDLTGRLLVQRTQITEGNIAIHREDIKPGIYSLTITDGKGQIQSEKIVFE